MVFIVIFLTYIIGRVYSIKVYNLTKTSSLRNLLLLCHSEKNVVESKHLMSLPNTKKADPKKGLLSLY